MNEGLQAFFDQNKGKEDQFESLSYKENKEFLKYCSVIDALRNRNIPISQNICTDTILHTYKTRNSLGSRFFRIAAVFLFLLSLWYILQPEQIPPSKIFVSEHFPAFIYKEIEPFHEAIVDQCKTFVACIEIDMREKDTSDPVYKVKEHIDETFEKIRYFVNSYTFSRKSRSRGKKS